MPNKAIFNKLRVLPAFLIAAAVLAGMLAAGLMRGQPTTSAGPTETGSIIKSAPDEGQAVKKAVEKLIEEEKYQAAADECARIREEARRTGDTGLWTWTLIRESQLRTALHSAETAVRFLKEEPWPDSPLDRHMLGLFYAQSLITYYELYQWEIVQREAVEAGGAVDLKAWTKEQIFEEAWQELLRVWQDRDSLAGHEPGEFPDFWKPGDYPDGIRDTLRDAVVYYMSRLLADTTFWTPREENETWLLDLAGLLAGAGETSPADASRILADPARHPIERIVALLGEHEAWSRRHSRPEASLEDRFELVRALHEVFDGEEDRSAILKHLTRFLRFNRKYAWWAMGQALLAELTRREDKPDALLRARTIAAEGNDLYPDSPGGWNCLYIVQSIEAPHFSAEAMKIDAASRRSVRITHRNLKQLYVRAYLLDIEKILSTARYFVTGLPINQIRSMVESRKPDAAWRVDLPRTRDYRDHYTYTNLPAGMLPGIYMFVLSTNEDFGYRDNKMVGLKIEVSDLVILSRGEENAVPSVGPGDPRTGGETFILSGTTGRALAGVKVELYRVDWNTDRHRLVGTRTTDANGRVSFEPRRQRGRYLLLARKNQDIASHYSSLFTPETSKTTWSRGALIYTDRSIYRPGQRLFWKILAYEGERDLGRLAPEAGQPATVWLEDVNGERIAQASVSTNAFGTASGEFVIPAAGRPLGVWRLRSSPPGQTEVRVEEYKRPTFEVTVLDPEKPLRLNRAARLKAEARYYFGLPVTTGEAAWRVTREPVFPGWWWWDPGRSRSQAVAGGRARLDEDGSFAIEFTPGADERKALQTPGLTYRYKLSVDVTDEGGETRSAERTFRLGFVSVEVTITPAAGFFMAGSAMPFTLNLRDLNGIPREGQGIWRVFRLVQPGTTLLPADQPVPVPPGGLDPSFPPTEGDRLRPRWETGLSNETILHLWKEGNLCAEGKVSHDAGGTARIELAGLETGAYRIIYETKDESGSVCMEMLNFLVAGDSGPYLKLPLVLKAEKASVQPGATARFSAGSGWSGQPILVETFIGGDLRERRWFETGNNKGLIEIPVTEDMRGGFGLRLTAVRDHQFMSQAASVFVPWDNKELELSFATFTDKIKPGGRETWRVTVKTPEGKPAEKGAAELLAYMYDRSLDIFTPHHPWRLISLYPDLSRTVRWETNIGTGRMLFIQDTLPSVQENRIFRPDELLALGSYGIGGPGRFLRGYLSPAIRAQASVTGETPGSVLGGKVGEHEPEAIDIKKTAEAEPEPPQRPSLRSDFAETAFWQPHLLTGEDGTASIEFTVPDSVTGWRVFVHALMSDFSGGTLEAEAMSFKEIMVRPYLPRFFREGDQAGLRVMVNNSGDREAAGEVTLEITDPLTGDNLAPAFGLKEVVPPQPFTVKPGGGSTVVFPLSVPARVGTIAFKITARSGSLADGELRLLPVLPGRMHLDQSRFAALKGGEKRELRFDDLARTDDPTRINELLVVTVDAQLFYGLLEALPYLVNYPYECTEQTLNRFLSTGILTSLYDKYPQVASLARQLAARETAYESFDEADPNRKMTFEETPWLETSRGGTGTDLTIEKVLEPRVAENQRRAALDKLLKAQTSTGGFPWFPGGRPSPFMTMYIVHGFSRALEFGVDVPREPVVRAFGYLHEHYLDEFVSRLMTRDIGWELITFLNYVLSNFPDSSWTGGVFTDKERADMLYFSFRHWTRHSPYLKAYLALTLKRNGRVKDAELVWDSVMDSARTTADGATSWAPEDRGWLWYNDTIETHAFALRTLMELDPDDKRSEGLVQWLFLNKKLNHWKSTRATAEVLYSVAYFLKHTGALAVSESVTAETCGVKTTFSFEPEKYSGKKNQLIIQGEKIGPDCASTQVSKTGQGLALASATWHFSTEKMPAQGEGDLFTVERAYFKRERKGQEIVLRPLAEGAPLAVGDEIEAHLSIRARHQAEYVHLRDPRPAGCEPVTLVSGYKWDLGLARYEEIRDSGTNFFMEWLPEGEYTLKYRLRCAMAGSFKTAPAVLQSMYAPEFGAYSSGALIIIK